MKYFSENMSSGYARLKYPELEGCPLPTAYGSSDEEMVEFGDDVLTDFHQKTYAAVKFDEDYLSQQFFTSASGYVSPLVELSELDDSESEEDESDDSESDDSDSEEIAVPVVGGREQAQAAQNLYWAMLFRQQWEKLCAEKSAAQRIFIVSTINALAGLGYPPAYLALGKIYEEGYFVARDYYKAEEYYQKYLDYLNTLVANAERNAKIVQVEQKLAALQDKHTFFRTSRVYLAQGIANLIRINLIPTIWAINSTTSQDWLLKTFSSIAPYRDWASFIFYFVPTAFEACVVVKTMYEQRNDQDYMRTLSNLWNKPGRSERIFNNLMWGPNNLFFYLWAMGHADLHLAAALQIIGVTYDIAHMSYRVYQASRQIYELEKELESWKSTSILRNDVVENYIQPLRKEIDRLVNENIGLADRVRHAPRTNGNLIEWETRIGVNKRRIDQLHQQVLANKRSFAHAGDHQLLQAEGFATIAQQLTDRIADLQKQRITAIKEGSFKIASFTVFAMSFSVVLLALPHIPVSAATVAALAFATLMIFILGKLTYPYLKKAATGTYDLANSALTNSVGYLRPIADQGYEMLASAGESAFRFASEGAVNTVEYLQGGLTMLENTGQRALDFANNGIESAGQCLQGSRAMLATASQNAWNNLSIFARASYDRARPCLAPLASAYGEVADFISTQECFPS